MSSAAAANDDRPACSVCRERFHDNYALDRHMKQSHTNQWTNQNQGRPVTLYPCDQPGCGKLASNTRKDAYVDHLSSQHGVDVISKKMTTEVSYLKRKTADTLLKHIEKEGNELNELNTMILDIEDWFAQHPPAVPYQSCHGLDVTLVFETDPAQLPGTRSGLVAELVNIREERKKLGELNTMRGVWDVREAVYDDLNKLLG